MELQFYKTMEKDIVKFERKYKGKIYSPKIEKEFEELLNIWGKK